MCMVQDNGSLMVFPVRTVQKKTNKMKSIDAFSEPG